MEAYDQAAIRHYKDGELLASTSRLENADHLFGLAAECAIKVALAHSISQKAISQVPYVHINQGLWGAALLQIQAKRFPGLALLLKGNNPFSDWDVGQRYFGDGVVKQPTIDNHRKAARRLLGAVGLIPA
jgi:hypothetical protein